MREHSMYIYAPKRGEDGGIPIPVSTLLPSSVCDVFRACDGDDTCARGESHSPLGRLLRQPASHGLVLFPD